MAHYTRDDGIRCFEPDDDETGMYINCNYHHTLDQMISTITEKWPGVSMSDIWIDAIHVHTDCLGCDRYDPTDYTNYIVIRRMK